MLGSSSHHRRRKQQQAYHEEGYKSEGELSNSAFCSPLKQHTEQQILVQQQVSNKNEGFRFHQSQRRKGAVNQCGGNDHSSSHLRPHTAQQELLKQQFPLLDREGPSSSPYKLDRSASRKRRESLDSTASTSSITTCTTSGSTAHNNHFTLSQSHSMDEDDDIQTKRRNDSRPKNPTTKQGQPDNKRKNGKISDNEYRLKTAQQALEGSIAAAIDFLKTSGVPTARYVIATRCAA